MSLICVANPLVRLAQRAPDADAATISAAIARLLDELSYAAAAIRLGAGSATAEGESSLVKELEVLAGTVRDGAAA